MILLLYADDMILQADSVSDIKEVHVLPGRHYIVVIGVYQYTKLSLQHGTYAFISTAIVTTI